MSRSSADARRPGAAWRSSARAASASTSLSSSPRADAPDGHASDGRVDDPAIAAFRDEWGIDAAFAQRGGLKPPQDHPPPRRLWLLQRKDEKVGAGLAKTTGWIRRALLKKRGVAMIAGVEYERIDDAGLHITVDGVRNCSTSTRS